MLAASRNRESWRLAGCRLNAGAPPTAFPSPERSAPQPPSWVPFVAVIVVQSDLVLYDYRYVDYRHIHTSLFYFKKKKT